MQAKVLIIEDVKEMADLIRLYLQKEGMDAAICETGEEGLAQFGRERYDPDLDALPQRLLKQQP